MGRFFFFMVMLVIGVLWCSAAASEDERKLISVGSPPVSLKYHNGLLLRGKQTVSLVWYGGFSPEQRAIITVFLGSLSAGGGGQRGVPTVSSWWSTTAGYVGSPPEISLARQLFDETYSLGRRLNASSIGRLARRAAGQASMAVVLTAVDVAVDGFCLHRCASHNWWRTGGRGGAGFPFIWVGNAGAQCPGTCAWPFYVPPPGAGPPPRPPVVAPPGDPAMYGMVVNLAAMIAGAVTNPNGGGYFQGPPTAPLEAVTACPGIFGSGAYPGYAGKVIVDPATGVSFNAVGIAGRRYLLPAMWDPHTSQCKTST